MSSSTLMPTSMIMIALMSAPAIVTLCRKMNCHNRIIEVIYALLGGERSEV
jgi:hypothetical protein